MLATNHEHTRFIVTAILHRRRGFNNCNNHSNSRSHIHNYLRSVRQLLHAQHKGILLVWSLVFNRVNLLLCLHWKKLEDLTLTTFQKSVSFCNVYLLYYMQLQAFKTDVTWYSNLAKSFSGRQIFSTLSPFIVEHYEKKYVNGLCRPSQLANRPKMKQNTNWSNILTYTMELASEAPKALEWHLISDC